MKSLLRLCIRARSSPYLNILFKKKEKKKRKKRRKEDFSVIHNKSRQLSAKAHTSPSTRTVMTCLYFKILTLMMMSPSQVPNCTWRSAEWPWKRNFIHDQLGGEGVDTECFSPLFSPVKVLVAQSCLALWPARLLCPWDFPGKNT